MGLFSNSTTQTLEPMLTEEQKQAQQILAQLASTGQIGGINTGEQYGGSLGNYQATPTEGAAVNRIYELLNSGTPTALATAEKTLTGLSDTTFDPSDPSSGYASYQRQVARATKDADDVINRESAITGNRFGDRILNSKVDLAAQQSDLLGGRLADLYNNAQNRALQASNGLTSLAGTQNAIDINNINAGAQYGGLQRMLDTAKANAQYGEWQRARGERLGTSIDAANSLYNKNINYGQKNVTTSSVSPWGQLLNAGLTAAGTYLGGPVGGMIGSTIGGQITGANNAGAMGDLAGTLGTSGNQGGGQLGKLLQFGTTQVSRL